MSDLNTATPSSIPDESFLEAQTRFFLEQRLPYRTQVGSEDRTFYFRCERQEDAAPLRSMVDWALEQWWTSPLSPTGDADVKMTLRPDSLTLGEIRHLFGLLEGAELAAQTVAPAADYIGAHRFVPLEFLPAQVPGVDALRQASEGLARYYVALERLMARAAKADEYIWGHLPMDWAG